MSEKVANLIEEIKTLSVLELSEMVKALAEFFFQSLYHFGQF